uniref:TERF1 (TRF1)-interacting nuclear factor 2 n=1 Tax=Scophthalmus maximus TaxID=52904 RepID=A0A8D2ZY07_SCOMX
SLRQSRSTTRPGPDVSLPFAALQLLAPPVRLVSAALWKEFVTSACETVPGLLTVRHQGKLTLGLRGRLILELCRTQPDPEVIEPHLRRIRAPASPPSSSSAPRKDVKIARTIESFHSFVRTLLTDPTERELFFKEEFPVDYGPKFDEELEKLLWEFLIRLDQLLPVPNLAQTVSWLSDAPPILEECARSATQPQLLNVLLQHQTCLGHLEPAAPSDQPTAAQASAVDQPGSGTQTSFITPVFGIISNKDIPIMISGGTRALRGDKPASSQDGTDKHCESSKFTVVKERQTPNGDAVKEGEEEKLEEERVTSKRSRGVKRKQPDERQSEFEEEEDVVRMTRSGKKRMGWGDRRTVESEEDGAETVGNEELRTAVLATCMTQMGVEALQLPENPSLCSIFLSCLSSQPRVLLEKLPVASACAHRTGGGGKSSYRQQQQQNQRKKSPVKAPRRSGTGDQPGKPDSDTSGLDDKE